MISRANDLPRHPRFPFWAWLVFGWWPLAGTAAPRINEWVAANETGLRDEDGEFSDWIEIHNPRAEDSVSLAGWALSDDAGNPDRWRFPPVVLEPGAYLVVWASGKDRREGESLHTDFKLDRDGEFLQLTDPAGVGVSVLEPAYPAMEEDESFGWDEVLRDYRPWRTPTPGAANREDPVLGPLLFAPRSAGQMAREGADWVVSVRVLENGRPVRSVVLKQRVMYRVESIVPLADDGEAPDEIAGDGRYTGSIAARTLFGSRYRAGEMIRWAFEATDQEGITSRLPELEDGVVAQPEYFGTVVESPGASSKLPVLHWFTETPERAASPGGSRASAFFDGHFYDNLFVRRRGQFGAINWDKPKLKFDFNPGNHFRYDPGRRRVEEFNLQSHFADPSFMRENLAFAFFNLTGTPASETRHWRVMLNGEFHGLFSFVEQVDEDFLRRHGLDPSGALYKANGFPATLAVGSRWRSIRRRLARRNPTTIWWP